MGCSDFMSPCCGCSWMLQGSLHVCMQCGEPAPDAGDQANGSKMTDALQASEDLAARGATAPRVSLESMKDKIGRADYFTAGDVVFGSDPHAAHPLDLLTICILTMSNGFTVIGKSAPASPENFDAEKGKQFAFEDAIKQLWPLEGYALRERLARES